MEARIKVEGGDALRLVRGSCIHGYKYQVILPQVPGTVVRAYGDIAMDVEGNVQSVEFKTRVPMLRKHIEACLVGMGLSYTIKLFHD